MQYSVETPIGFADGKVMQVEKLGMRVRVVVQAWDESIFEVEFEEVIGVRESLAFELSDLVIAESDSDFVKWCIGRAYEDKTSQGELAYQFLDSEREPCLEIVAKGIAIRSKQQ